MTKKEETPAVEEEAAEAGMSVVDADEAAVIEDIEDTDDEEEADDGLLAEVEEDEDDVTGIIDADIGKDER